MRWAALALGLAALWAGGCGGDGSPGAPATDAAASGEEGVALADSLVGAWIEAAGGEDAWSSVRSVRYTVTTVWYDSAGEVRRMRPRRVEIEKDEDGFRSRIERPEAEGLYVQVFTGDTAWAALNGRPLPPDHPATEESEYVARDVHYWIGLPHKLRDPGVRLRAEPDPEGGHVVRVGFGEGTGIHSGDRYAYHFRDADPFPEEVHYSEQGSDTWARTVWSDFTTTGPLTYVGTRRYLEEGRPTLELRIDDVVVDPPLPDSLFRPPPLASPGGGR